MPDFYEDVYLIDSISASNLINIITVIQRIIFKRNSYKYFYRIFLKATEQNKYFIQNISSKSETMTFQSMHVNLYF